ncbi:MAG: NAD(P)H-dependent oxidoreductase [Bacteroidia bacterium]|nr:NAD(P)H-dependent oxidoreductase [Bacteroidia bacterium]
MKVVIILGSIREGRKTHRVAHYLVKMLNEQPGVETILLDLESHELPLLKDRWAEQETVNPVLADFSAQLKAADALIFVSPEYHGSYTGVLKNAVDHFWKEFSHKPIGVVATGSGKFGGINASTEMQLLILSLGAFPMPYKLLVPNVNRLFGETDEPLDEFFLKSVNKFVAEFCWFAEALVKARQAQIFS